MYFRCIPAHLISLVNLNTSPVFQKIYAHMAWILRDNLRARGAEWKEGWTARTLSSVSLPPFPLIAIFDIIIFFMSLSNSIRNEQKHQTEQVKSSFEILLFLVVLLIILVRSTMSSSSIFDDLLPREQDQHDLIYEAGSSSWGVALWIVLLLLIILYLQSSVHSVSLVWTSVIWTSVVVIFLITSIHK